MCAAQWTYIKRCTSEVYSSYIFTCVYTPCNPYPDQDMEHFLLPRGCLLYLPSYFLSSSPRDNQGYDIYFIDEFCLLLSFKWNHAVYSIFVSGFRFTYAMFSSSFFFIVWIYHTFYPFYCWLFLFGLLWIMLLCFCDHSWTCFVGSVHSQDPLFWCSSWWECDLDLLFFLRTSVSLYDCGIPDPNIFRSPPSRLPVWAGLGSKARHPCPKRTRSGSSGLKTALLKTADVCFQSVWVAYIIFFFLFLVDLVYLGD